MLSRPTNVLVALLLSLYVLSYHRRRVWGFVLSGSLPVFFQFWYNSTYFGDPFRTQFPSLGYFTIPLREGLPGILLSPIRGLLVYSPIFLFAMLGIGRVWWCRGDSLLRYVSVGILPTVLLISKWGHWWGGWCYGPRLLADLTPLLSLFLVLFEGMLHRHRVFAGVFVICTVWSIAAHTIDAFWDDYRWNQNLYFGWHHRERLWLWTDNQLINPPFDAIIRASMILRGLQTSRTAPEQLSASYRTNLPPILNVVASDPIQVRFEAVNTGKAVWLSWSKGYEGVVRLWWRWRSGEHYLSERAGPVPLRYDVFPQQLHDFWTVVASPSEPGTYVLELGLASEFVGWFSDHGNPPILVTVTVTPLKPPYRGE